MRALEALHEGFGRNFGAALSGYLRTIIEVSVAHIEQLTYSEFIHSLPNPTCFNLLKAEQLDGQLCLEISPLIIYPIIDRLLGGSNADLFIPQRPLTQIEQRLVQRITDRATHHFSEAWSNLTPVTFTVEDFESNPQLVQIVPPNETVVVIGFELKMGNRAGTMSLCIPYNVIEPIMGVLAAQNWFSYQRKGGQDDHLRKLTRNVNNAPVEMRASSQDDDQAQRSAEPAARRHHHNRKRDRRAMRLSKWRASTNSWDNSDSSEANGRFG